MRVTLTLSLLAFLLCHFASFGQDLPVAVDDFIAPVFLDGINQGDTTIYVNVLLNDYDPGGAEIKLFNVDNRIGQEDLMIDFTDSVISITFTANNTFEYALDYRVAIDGDTTLISNQAKLLINPTWDPDYPVARNDTIIIYRGYTDSLNVLLNDYHPSGDSLFIEFPGGGQNDSLIYIYSDFYTNEPYQRRFYFLSDTVWYLQSDLGLVFIEFRNNEFYDSLDLNNINARFNCYNLNFWDLDEFPHFKVPNGSEVSSIFSQNFWIGGLDENENLHIAAERYRQVGIDYWHGPVSEVYDKEYDARWLHVWKLNREEIEYHKANWWQPGYEAMHDIQTWPGNGDTTLGQSAIIAPFEDRNGNGIYEPENGDAPMIKGDQALFYVFNDTREPHTASGGWPLGIEIRAMAYAFDRPEDSALWNTIFLHYDIINRSDTSYHDMYLGVFTDTDLGYAWDDYIESDVNTGMFFTYNGNDEDIGLPERSYGAHPPAQGIQFLGGPFMEADGLDNPKYDAMGNLLLGEGINGLNFGDGIIDNERFGVHRFLYFNSGGGGIWPDPYEASDYYERMQGLWADHSHMIYGGNAHIIAGGVGPECNYMFPRDSDPLNWGTAGIWPNGGYNQNGLYWYEEQAGNNPNDRRGLGTIGPFDLAAGQTQPLDIAYPWARDFEGTAWSSALLLKERAAYIKELFQQDPELFSRITELHVNASELVIYPNPVIDKFRLNKTGETQQGWLQIFNGQGVLLTSEKIVAGEAYEKDIQSWKPGIYFIRLISKDEILTGTLIKQ